MMYAVVALRHKKPLASPVALMQAERIAHQCNDADSAVQVLRDLVTVADRDVANGDLWGYSVCVSANAVQ